MRPNEHSPAAGVIAALFLSFLTCTVPPLRAQETLYPQGDRYSADSWMFTASAGMTKYLGEFTDHHVGPSLQLGLLRPLSDAVDVGVAVSAGTLLFERRPRRHEVSAYLYQFGVQPEQLRVTPFVAGEAVVDASLYPAHYMTLRFSGGAGVTLFRPEDYAVGSTRVVESAEQLALHLHAGMGVETWLSRSLAITVSLRGVYFLSDRLDAFPSEQISERYLWPDNPSAARSSLYTDSYLALLIGIRLPLRGALPALTDDAGEE
jgi:hypothetical protein